MPVCLLCHEVKQLRLEKYYLKFHLNLSSLLNRFRLFVMQSFHPSTFPQTKPQCMERGENVINFIIKCAFVFY